MSDLEKEGVVGLGLFLVFVIVHYFIFFMIWSYGSDENWRTERGRGRLQNYYFYKEKLGELPFSDKFELAGKCLRKAIRREREIDMTDAEILEKRRKERIDSLVKIDVAKRCSENNPDKNPIDDMMCEALRK